MNFTAFDVLGIFLLLQLKHFLFDFLLQGEFQWRNKGTYGHPGGLLHAGLAGAGTFGAFAMFAPASVCFIVALIDALVHYHIDWAKMNANKKLGLTPNTEGFWFLLGADQLAHQLTYLALIAMVILGWII